MLTGVFTMDPDQHRNYAALVARLIPVLGWRHTGLDALQAYVQEGVEKEIRVHIWDVSLRREGIEESGMLHDHRFDMTSYMLLGNLIQEEYRLFDDVDGAWQMHEVVHARKALKENKVYDGGLTTLPGYYGAAIDRVTINEGNYYTFGKREFHGTYFSDFAITLVIKTNQDQTKPARILSPRGKPVVHAFANTWERHQFGPILEKAKLALEDLFAR